MNAPALSAHDVKKSYWLGKREIPILKGVNLAVERGEMVALLGASGAGKSTLLHLLGLLDTPTSGEIRFDGQPVHNFKVGARAKLRHQFVGFVFQFYHLIPELTAIQNVLLAAMMQKSVCQYWKERRTTRAAAEQILDEVGLSQRLSHRPAELSGGERQRVAIARALLQNPRVVLADEPTGNLDSETADDVMQMLFRINRERQLAFLLVTHNEDLARKCHRVVRLRDGMVVG